MYYINGRYYDPELFSYIDLLDIETVVSSASTIGGLNPYAICTDNPVNLGDADFSILTNTDLMPDPVYDPLSGYSWWDRNWKNVIRYGLFTLTFIVSIVLMCIPGTQLFGIKMFAAGLGLALSGMIVGGIISGIISAIQGNGFFTGFADGAITGFVDGFTSGAILFCISSAVSALLVKIKPSNQPKVKKTSGLTQKQIDKIKEVSQNMPRGEYSVYLSVTDDYVGITKDFGRRAAEHLRNSNRVIKEIVPGVNKESARIIEQTIIEYVGRTCKNTGPLVNIINSIATSNPLYLYVQIFKEVCGLL